MLVSAAHADKVTVTVTTQLPGQAKYTGKVKSKDDHCLKHRTVQVYDLSQPSPLFIGQTTTDKKGDYELIEFAPVAGQQVQIVVPKKKTGKGKCPEVQKTATVPAPPAS
jgi:hypothetical protein